MDVRAELVCQCHVMFIKDAEPVDISFLPRLGLPAEMENGGMFHNMVHIIDPAAAEKIIVVVPGVIIPGRVVDLQCPMSIQRI